MHFPLLGGKRTTSPALDGQKPADKSRQTETPARASASGRLENPRGAKEPSSESVGGEIAVQNNEPGAFRLVERDACELK